MSTISNKLTTLFKTLLSQQN